ncbi:hypothetical protein SAMN06272755_3328 [Picosynechococcus sp. OG1]|nr:hypothetical protein SAMN06272755_3328 [Picosynechococcus sp. OG1]SMQ86562.1 hypothetical protein SAMN06272774_3326 [Synechococcus sp. 7002]
MTYLYSGLSLSPRYILFTHIFTQLFTHVFVYVLACNKNEAWSIKSLWQYYQDKNLMVGSLLCPTSVISC